MYVGGGGEVYVIDNCLDVHVHVYSYPRFSCIHVCTCISCTVLALIFFPLYIPLFIGVNYVFFFYMQIIDL